MSNRKRLVTVAMIVIGLILGAAVSYPLYDSLTHGQSGEKAAAVKDSNYSEIRAKVAAGDIRTITFYGQTSAAAKAKDGTVYRAVVPALVAADFAKDVVAQGVLVDFKSEEFIPYDGNLTAETALAVLGNLVIFGFLGVMFYMYVLKGPMGRSKFKPESLTASKDIPVRFDDVAGCDGEKQELMEIVQFLRDPAKFDRLGGRVPPGVLMSGPPGTGKTLLARAVAGEAGVPFFSVSGSDFVEMYVGVGASRVRSIFAKAKKKAPCILFIDEIDAVGRARSGGQAQGAHEEREQTLNQLLVEMDGFKANSGIIVIAATNRPDILDKALTRPGRFSRHIVLQNPDVAGRERILGVHARKVRLDDGVTLHTVARGTPGFSGAELANLVNEAAILAARNDRDAVTMHDFDMARDRILMGNERPGLVISEDDRRLTAYHEAGHAVVALHCPASDPIHKVTIVPRGQALGMVVRLPEKDSPAMRRSKIVADLAVAMGGRAAEEMIFGADDVTTGASGDIQMASYLARRMVMEWGMSEKVGMIAYNSAHGGPAGEQMISPATSREIDGEVKELVDQACERAMTILDTYSDELHAIAQALLERESLTGEEVDALVAALPKGGKASAAA